MRLSAVQHGWSPHQQRQQSEKPPHPEKQPRIATSPRSRHVNASDRRFLHDQVIRRSLPVVQAFLMAQFRQALVA